MRKPTKTHFGAILVSVILLLPLCGLAGGTRKPPLSLDFLTNETQVNLEFDYSDIKAGFRYKECMPEQEFVAKHAAELNAKIPGAGDTWKSEWPVQRVITWEPEFKNTLNKHLAEEKPPLEFGHFKSAKYTLILKIKVMKLQRDAFIGPEIPADLTSEAAFVESDNRTNSVAVISLNRVSGVRPMAMYQELDMSGAYWQSAKRLVALIRKKAR